MLNSTMSTQSAKSRQVGHSTGQTTKDLQQINCKQKQGVEGKASRSKENFQLIKFLRVIKNRLQH